MANKTVETSVAHSLPRETQQKLDASLEKLNLRSLDQLPQGIKICEALLKVLFNAFKLPETLKTNYFYPFATDILQILTQIKLNHSAAYSNTYTLTLQKITERYHWYQLFKGAQAHDHQLLIMNNPWLYGYYKERAFTRDEMLSVSAKQRVHFINKHVQKMLIDPNPRYTFRQAMELNANELLEITETALQTKTATSKLA